MVTQEYLKQRLYYDMDSGYFYWRNPHPSSRMNPWDKAGTLGLKGYIKIVLLSKTYEAHRLAWLYMHGEFPKGCMDHINGNKSDNRACNLRVATKAQNNFNVGVYANNTSGVKGVHWSTSAGKWRAAISANRKRVIVGSFKNLEDARKAVAAARIMFHGEFAHAALAAQAKQVGA